MNNIKSSLVSFWQWLGSKWYPTSADFRYARYLARKEFEENKKSCSSVG
jgi:hypothetical protein